MTQEALKALVDVLDKCTPELDRVCLLAKQHGAPYRGPTFGEYVTAARAALSAVPPQDEALVDTVARAIFDAWALAKGVDGTWTDALEAAAKGYKVSSEIVTLARAEAIAAIAVLYTAIPHERVSTLWSAIAHGDDIHREWLKEAIDNHFAGKPVPPPRDAKSLYLAPPEPEGEQ